MRDKLLCRNSSFQNEEWTLISWKKYKAMCKVTHIWTSPANERRDTLRIEYGPSLSDLSIRVNFRCIVLDPKRELGDETPAAMIF
jgi:hypothetical protein